ncbi:hypothetical protein PR048_017546 [Dryococelus australis]|uniref:Uncharacterized protein n=1 Tax=Dryococelus australis TaxID=614101 RepID=A0ABQ9H9U8_9NEOP|nr:hypothetical protein PR048_017546 [Dryococelus australis]
MPRSSVQQSLVKAISLSAGVKFWRYDCGRDVLGVNGREGVKPGDWRHNQEQNIARGVCVCVIGCNCWSIMRIGAAVAERLAYSPATKANRVQSPAGSLNFCKWESCRTMPLVGGFLGDLPFPRPFIPAPRHIHLNHPIGSQDLAVQSDNWVLGGFRTHGMSTLIKLKIMSDICEYLSGIRSASNFNIPLYWVVAGGRMDDVPWSKWLHISIKEGGSVQYPVACTFAREKCERVGAGGLRQGRRLHDRTSKGRRLVHTIALIDTRNRLTPEGAVGGTQWVRTIRGHNDREGRCFLMTWLVSRTVVLLQVELAGNGSVSAYQSTAAGPCFQQRLTLCVVLSVNLYRTQSVTHSDLTATEAGLRNLETFQSEVPGTCLRANKTRRECFGYRDAVARGIGGDLCGEDGKSPTLFHSHVGTVHGDAGGRRFFSGISSFPRPCIPALLHIHLAPPPLALKTRLVEVWQSREGVSGTGIDPAGCVWSRHVLSRTRGVRNHGPPPPPPQYQAFPSRSGGVYRKRSGALGSCLPPAFRCNINLEPRVSRFSLPRLPPPYPSTTLPSSSHSIFFAGPKSSSTKPVALARYTLHGENTARQFRALPAVVMCSAWLWGHTRLWTVVASKVTDWSGTGCGVQLLVVIKIDRRCSGSIWEAKVFRRSVLRPHYGLRHRQRSLYPIFTVRVVEILEYSHLVIREGRGVIKSALAKAAESFAPGKAHAR